jgi:hypothetical protein
MTPETTKTVTTQVINQQPVVVQKVVKVKKKRSLVNFLSAAVFLLCLFIVIGGILAAALWLHTFKVFTQEKTVAELYVSQKYIKDGKPTVRIRYTPYDDVSGWWGVFGSESNSTDKEVEAEIIGDRVFIEADFVRWNNWLTFLNFKPVYKINRIAPSFQRSADVKQYPIDEFVDINGGPDEFAARLQENPGKYKWFAQSVFISSAGTNALSEDATYLVKVTEDAVVLERKP